ncbi:MAG: peptidoglycan-binding domain-containing protein [Acidimicrobiales bacterium]
MNPKRTISAVVLLAAVVGAGFLVVAADGTSENDTDATTPTASAAATVQVTRQTLTETAETTGTVGHGDAVELPIESQGIVTWAPDQDDVLAVGDTAVRVDNRPVTLAAGTTPLYRELRVVGSSERDEAGDRLGHQTGDDVAQLQQFLVDEGFDDDGRLEVDADFGPSTKRAVQDWQEAVGHPATGRVDRSQLVFVDRDLVVEQAPAVGQPFTALTMTEPARTVTATVAAAKRSFFAEGATVDLETDGNHLDGTVTDTTRTTGPDGTTAYEIEISIDAELADGVESVDVTATKTIATNVLTVPVRALLALAGGGWAVEVPVPNGTELRRVELDQVVDTTASITGIDEGTEVVVPT